MAVTVGSARDRAAFVSWSAIAEPGDHVAGALVGALGAGEALAWVQRSWADPVAATSELLAHLPRDSIDRVMAAAQRWRLRRDALDPAPHVARAHKVGAVAVTPVDDEWPAALRDLGLVMPHALWVRGDPAAVRGLGSAVAVVGSRATTAYGEHMAARLSAGLCDRGRTVVSGGAYGIDARAHRAALAAHGRTVAVLAGGIDRLYPAGNTELLRAIIDTGAVVSELPPGYAPYRARFLTRNRIIAAAAATVVVEAAYRSGALSTARHASDLGRHVGAVPGQATSPSSAGCHELIRSGAVLTTSAAEVLDLIEPLGSPGPVEPGDGKQADSDVHRRLLDALRGGGAEVAAAARECGVSVAEASAALGVLEMRGAVRRDGGRWVAASSPASPSR